jgi:hypothetical protein
VNIIRLDQNVENVKEVEDANIIELDIHVEIAVEKGFVSTIK